MLQRDAVGEDKVKLQERSPLHGLAEEQTRHSVLHEMCGHAGQQTTPPYSEPSEKTSIHREQHHVLRSLISVRHPENNPLNQDGCPRILQEKSELPLQVAPTHNLF